MATALPGTAFHSSSFIRLLADLADARPAPPAPGPAPGLADTLAGWLTWTDAIALSAALNAAPAPADGAVAPPSSADAAALQQTVAQVRNALALAVRQDPSLGGTPPARRTPHRGQAVVADPDDDPVARLQRCHVLHQRAMDAQLGPLRVRLRAALASRSPALARLAALDAVLAQSLLVRERHLLGQVPNLLTQPARRHLAEALADQAPGAPPSQTDPQRGDPQRASLQHADPQQLKRLKARWQALLLAELDSRMQPIEGLLAALQHAPGAAPTPTSSPGRAAPAGLAQT